jgi:hypothetical protein
MYICGLFSVVSEWTGTALKNNKCRLEDSANSLEIIILPSYLHSFERNGKDIYTNKLGREELELKKILERGGFICWNSFLIVGIMSDSVRKQRMLS